MAVYRCEVKPLRRAAGRSAVAAAAYRAGVRLHDEGSDRQHDYRRRQAGIVRSGIVVPAHAPAWARVRGKLWNHAEAAENRANSLTAREIIISLPHENAPQLHPKSRH